MKDNKESRTIFVILTTQCNLRCAYCYEANKSQQYIEATRAIQCLSDDIEANRNRFRDFAIVFHGGEPFMRFETMRIIAETMFERFRKIPIVCNATTNGTILTDEMRRWLTANKNRFVCTLSLDGGRKTHNRNRCNSYDLIDREFFRTTWPHQSVKMTVSPNTLPAMYENIIELYDEGFDVNPSLACEVGWNIETDIPILEQQLDKLIAFYIANPNKIPGKLLDISPEVFSPYNPIPHNRACGAGANIVTFDVNGNKYPCHAFISDFNKEKQYNRKEIDSLFEYLNSKTGLELSPGCAGCYAYPACSPCYGLNYSNRHDMANYDKKMCYLIKVRIAAAANLYARMLLNRDTEYLLLRGKSDTEKANIIAGIIELQNHLKPTQKNQS